MGMILNAFLFLSLILTSCNSDDKESNVAVTIRGGDEAQSDNDETAVGAGPSASSLKLKVYKIGFSSSGDCSNPVVVDLTGEYLDFSNNPDLGSGTIPARNYKCVMIEMSDHIKFTPAQDEGAHCTGGTEYPQDVCVNDGLDLSQFPATKSLDGTELTGCRSGNQEDRLVMYLSVESKTNDFFNTNSSSAVRFYFFPPRSQGPLQLDFGGSTYDLYGGFHLMNSFNAASNNLGVFYMDTTGKVASDNTNSTCEIDTPDFGFYQMNETSG
ncbi:MAG: hypothetical protein OXB88_03925 [Bacteriovoracales bacterium]|nr:hypothetical protein [Bacteriovoracales bacterium]